LAEYKTVQTSGTFFMAAMPWIPIVTFHD